MPDPYRLSSAARTRVFDALHAVAWADGWLRPEEVSAAQGAALVLSVDPPSLASRLRSAPPPLAIDGLTPRERHFVFAGGAWVALADGNRARQEVQLLRSIGCRAGFDEGTMAELFDVARWVRAVHGRAASWADEFGRLLQTTHDVVGRGSVAGVASPPVAPP